jgi:poly(hydroxyalkanoate) depolymerase family esterase
MKSKQITILLALLASLLALPNVANAGEWVNGSASNASGTRNYVLWVPSGFQNQDKRNPVPLLMMLHGCMQTPQDLAAISGMNQVADKNNFLVVYPDQTKEANPLRCWIWFDPKHQARDSGEPSILAAIVKQVAATYNIDARRVYVAGISAGAAMAVVMGATYPDVFHGIGVNSGLAFKAGSDLQSGLAAMKQGGPDPKQLGFEAFKSMRESWGDHPPRDKRRMPVIVFHGAADPYLNPINADQVIGQWARTNDYLDDGKDNDSVKAQPAKTIEGSVPAGHSYTKSAYNDSAGRLLLEKWIVKGLGHSWSGSPAAAPFADPKGPNASEEMWRFFRETTLAPGSPKPKAAKPRGRAK